MPSIYHVAITGSDAGSGSAEAPLRTISRAAALAHPGDTVVVHKGEYREWVRPARGGLSDLRRITYEAAKGERVVIKGSERITGWTREEGTVWKAVLPNGLFDGFNPFAEEVGGDWLVPCCKRSAHASGRGLSQWAQPLRGFCPCRRA